MKRLIFTITLLLAGGLVAAGVMVEQRTAQCRVETAGNMGPLGAALILPIADAAVSQTANKIMDLQYSNPVTRWFAYPVVVMNGYCQMAEAVKK